MNFKKTQLMVALSIFLTTVLFCGVIVTGAYENQNNTTNTNVITNNLTIDNKGMTVMEFGDVPRFGISVVSENVVVNRGGNTFKIMFDEQYKNYYNVEDYIHSTSKKREICFERKDLDSPKINISQTIYVTIPNNTRGQLSAVQTNNGDIRIENADNTKLTANSISGNIYISNSNAIKNAFIETKSGTITLINNSIDIMCLTSETGNVSVKVSDNIDNYQIDVNTQTSTTINVDGKLYNGGEFILNEPAKRSIIFDSNTGSLTIANMQTATIRESYKDKESKLSEDKNNIEIKKTIFDNSNGIKNIEINADVVNLDFQTSLNNIFEAIVSYPQKLAPLYEGVKLNMENTNQTATISIEYPDGEINQNSNINPDIDGYATLIVRIPQRQYNDVKLNLTATNAIGDFNINSSSLEIKNNAGDVSFDFTGKCDNISIENGVGNFTFYMDYIGKNLDIVSSVGDFNLKVNNEPKDINLNITNKRLSGFTLPEYWDYYVSSSESEDIDTIITYKNGNASNKINATMKLGAFNMNIGE